MFRMWNNFQWWNISNLFPGPGILRFSVAVVARISEPISGIPQRIRRRLPGQQFRGSAQPQPPRSRARTPDGVDPDPRLPRADVDAAEEPVERGQQQKHDRNSGENRKPFEQHSVWEVAQARAGSLWTAKNARLQQVEADERCKSGCTLASLLNDSGKFRIECQRPPLSGPRRVRSLDAKPQAVVFGIGPERPEFQPDAAFAGATAETEQAGARGREVRERAGSAAATTATSAASAATAAAEFGCAESPTHPHFCRRPWWSGGEPEDLGWWFGRRLPAAIGILPSERSEGSKSECF